jgi:DNA-binding PadR family transcriptional regulator
MPKKAMDILTESMFYVLLALMQGEMCGTDAAACVEERTQGRVLLGPATLYTVLGKFEKEKYIKEVRVEGRKRTYRITDKGRDAFEEELVRLRQCVADAEGGNI